MISSPSDLTVSVVVPAYNEERRLPSSIRKILDFMRNDPRISEIVLVDDGSRDATRTIMLDAAERNPAVRVVSYSENGGKGYAIRRGALAASRGMAVLVTDADLSTPIEDFNRLADRLQNHDIAIGSRAMAMSEIGIEQVWYRRFMGRTFNRIMRLITGIPFDDTQCGFKLFSARAAAETFPLAVIDRFAYDVELIVLANRAGLSVAEVPVHWDDSSDSRVRIVRDSFLMLLDVIRIRLRLGAFHRRPVR
ncbi:MAG TPA: dolichyl-phosphate beta-glucosyltransferase [Thermoanaerobaculia bacterium]|nr:dolichyl-phosphate beta-glucosyltransferase [Thermoanaerobaculia bacterium]